MKSKVSDKALATAHEKARALELNARQLSQAARSAKDDARQAKTNLKLAKQEAKLTRRAARDAKRAYSDARCAADEATAELEALEKRAPESPGKIPRRAVKPSPPVRVTARKRVSSGTKRRAAAARSVVRKASIEKSAPAMPASLLGSIPVQSDSGSLELATEVPGEIVPVASGVAPGDIAPVPADVFAGSPPQSDAAMSGGDPGGRQL